MKKMVSVILVTIILLSFSHVIAESVDLESLDDNAIVELYTQIQQEIVDRHIEKTATLTPGSYIAGRDFPAGTYIFTSLATGEEWGNLTIYSLTDNGKHDDQLFWKVVSAPEEDEESPTYFITINEGEELSCEVAFSLTIFAGVKFE